MSIVTNKTGDAFLEYRMASEREISNSPLYTLLHFCIIVVKHKEKVLLVFKRLQKKWELPGGTIEKGETPRECIIRELLEETNQTVRKIMFKGIMKFRLKYQNQIIYGALFSAYLDTIKPFKKTEEIEKILFWDLQSDIGYVDEIDRKLIEIVNNRDNESLLLKRQ